jgi:hypothetical protein
MARAALFALLLAALPALGETPKREFIYGAQLMTQKERDQYRRDFAAAPDETARERFRAGHRAKMDARAKKRRTHLDSRGIMPLFK